MKKEMLINVLQPEECRIAIVEDGILEELYVERTSQESYVGNIYKGRIVNIEPSIQAVFVDFGIGRNGFLHVSDVDPAYYKHLLPKHIREEMEAEEEAETRRDSGGNGGGGDRGGRDRDRGERGRGPRDRDRDRRDREPARVTEPESSVTIPRPPVTPVSFVDDADSNGFDDGLGFDDLSPASAERSETPPPLPESEIESEEEGIIEAEIVEAEVVELRPAPAPKPVAKREPEPEPENDEFGAGLDFDLPPAPKKVVAVEAPPVSELMPDVPPPLPTDVTDDNPIVEPEVEAETEGEAEKPAAKTRGRGRKKADAETDEKKAKPKRGRKKADAEDDADDEKPKPMPGSERRTSPDDEPEIQPFFDGADSDANFDIDGPNDRFASSPNNDSEASEPLESSETGFADAEGEGDDAPTTQPTETDDDEFHYTPRRQDEEGEGGRGRGRPRGRGGRGDRDRGDRGRPSGGGGGGGRGGPGGSRGGPPGRAGSPRDRGLPRLPIQEIFKRGQEVIVQVIKEGIGTKGPTLSTFISIAGRYLVLMPSLNRVGVSRKIEDPDARRRLRDTMTKLNPPKGVGFIVRTAAIDRNEQELQNDLAYLLRLWQVVVRRIKRMPSPVEIYRESDMITRTIRDIFTADIDTIWVDEANAFAHASEFLQIVMPRYADRIKFHGDTEPLFNKYRVDDEIAKINHKRIDLPQGGSIIIEQTEALVAIDVNSGNFRADNNAEETAYQMNMLAAKEIARQLRLRDLGGVIVNDFIDMRDEKHRRNVENVLRTALERDRARTKVLRISQFGIIEMTRQRMQQSLKKRIYNECGHCKGTGLVKTSETMSIDVMRLLQLAACRSPAITHVTLTVHMEAAFNLLNRKRKELAALEEKAKMEVQIVGMTTVSPEHLDIRCLDSNGNEVRLFGAPPPRMFRGPAPSGGGRPYNDRRDPRPLD